MNLLDLFILIPAVWLCIRGFSKGFIIELATLIGMVLGIIAAYYFAPQMQEFLKQYFTLSHQMLKILSYIIIFVLVLLTIYLIGKLIEKFIDILALGWLNKLLGAVFGLCKGLILIAIVFLIFEIADPHEKVIKPEAKEKSMFYQPLMNAVHTIVPTGSSTVIIL